MSISKIFIKCNNKYNEEFAQDVAGNLCCTTGNMGSFMAVLIFQTANSKSALNKIRFTLLSFHQRFELRLEAIQKRAARLPLFFCFTPALLLSCPVTDHSLSKYRRNDSYSQRIHEQFRIISDKLIASACHKVIAAIPRIGYFDLRAIRIARIFVSALVFVRSFSA